jgi:hypothetical protein
MKKGECPEGLMDAEPEDGFHIVHPQGFSEGNSPRWIPCPEKGEDMGYYAKTHFSLPEGVTLEEYYESRKPFPGELFERHVPDWSKWTSITPP